MPVKARIIRWDSSISILTMLWVGCVGNQGLISDRISYYTLHCLVHFPEIFTIHLNGYALN